MPRPRVLDSDRVRMVLAAGAQVGEGPVWDERLGTLLWVDTAAHQVHRLDPASGADVVVADLGAVVGAVQLTDGDTLVVSVDRELVALDEPSGRMRRLATLTEDPRLVVNDSACDPDGGCWAGVASHQHPGEGFVTRVTGDGVQRVVRTGMTVPNGIDWSPDRATVYMVDSPTGRIDAFADRDGELADHRVLAEVQSGVPDGLCVDRDGGIWVAIWGGWSVRRYLPDGELDVEVTLPVAQVASCALGGREYRELFVTTASIGLTASERRRQPAAGAIFAIEVDVPGVAPRRCALGGLAGD